MNFKILIISAIMFIKIKENGKLNGCTPSDMARSFHSFVIKLNKAFKITEQVKFLQTKFDIERNKIKRAFYNFLKKEISKDEFSNTKLRSLLDSKSKSFYSSERPDQYEQLNQDIQHNYDRLQRTFTHTVSTEPTAAVNYNEESKMTASQLISFHGFKCETHVVYTEDGYRLELHRVMPVPPDPPNDKLALLHHGLWGSSEDWLLLGPDKALPYLMCDAGYDVWLTNARGNTYSRSHANFKVDTEKFWNFSFHEMGVYDLPAVIDYIMYIKGNNTEINYVGHSMGGTTLLVLLSTVPEYNQVIKSATLLAPLAFMYQIKGPLKLLAEFYGLNGGNSLNFLGENEFLPIENFPGEVIEKYCKGDGKLCWNPLLLLTSGGRIISDNVLLHNVLGHTPSGTSAKTIIHYLQLVKSGQFHMYDHGGIDNVKTYGAKEPTTYNLSRITSPLIFFSSHDDWLCTLPNMFTLLPEISNVITHHIVKRYEFSHTDFVWGEDAPNVIFRLLLDILGRSN